MVPTLIESAHKTDKQRILGTAVVSFTIHVGVIAGAVFATLQTKGIDQTVKMDTTMVLLTPQQQPRPELQPAQLDVPVRGFQTVVVPPEIPTDIPPVDLHERFDPKDYSGAGVEGGRANGVVPDNNPVYVEAVVEQRPELLSGPPPYPELLRGAGIRGRVVVQRSEEHTSELQSRLHLVCRLLLEKKKNTKMGRCVRLRDA